MRTYLEIAAFALVTGTWLLIAAFGQTPASKTNAPTSPTDRLAVSTGAKIGEDREIRVANLPEGHGVFRTPGSLPGHLIVTSSDPRSPATSAEISRDQSGLRDTVRWQALPLLKSHAGREVTVMAGSPRTSAVSKTDAETTPADFPVKTEVRRNTIREIKRTFYLHVTDGSLSDPRQYAPVHCRSITEGKQVRVYLDQQRVVNARIERAARTIIETLETQILPRANREIGPWDDVDEDGMLSVLLTPWLEKLQGSKTSLKGFVRGSDFRPHYPEPFSNQSDVIYLNSELAADANYLTLLAHEYWHVLQCSYRLSIPETPLPMEDDWISEGTAHLAEIRFGGGSENLEHRINAWLASPESAPLAVENYYAEGLWRDDGCRGATFLFFHWCEQRFGRDLGQRMLTSPTAGFRNLQRVTGTDFDTLQMYWTIDMLDYCRPDPPFQSDAAWALFADTPVFQHMELDRLQIHRLYAGGEQETHAQFDLSPSATGYVRLGPGEWKIEAKQPVPLRLTFIPDRAGERVAKSVTTDGDSAQR